MTLINVTDVQEYLGRTLMGSELAGASATCVDVQAELEAWLGRSLEIGPHTETLPVYPYDSFLEVTYTPLVSVASFLLDGVTWPVGSYSLERSGIRLLNVASISAGFTVTDVSSATVAYIAGLGEPAVSAARRILKGRIGRIIDKARSDELGLEELRIGRDYLGKWLSEEFFTDDELKAVTRWKRRVTSLEPQPFGPQGYDPWRGG